MGPPPATREGTRFPSIGPVVDVTTPLSVAEAASLMAPSREADRIVVAVSGGPDSMALLYLAALAAREGLLPTVVAATVDHGLQSASAQIAAGVVAEARALGLDAHLLRWEGPKPATGIQEAARRERYRLLDGLAQEIGAPHLITAHSLDDQAETILFRMARGSGPAGLAGMRRSILREGIVHHRPFLGIRKARLVEACRQGGWPFIEDTANHDPRFARARLRRLLPALAEEGLDAERLARLGHRLARDEEALARLAAGLLQTIALPGPGESRRLAASVLMREPAALVLRVLEQALTDFACPGPPRLARLEHLVEALRRAHAAGRRIRLTLHGHMVTLGACDCIEIRPEGARRRGQTSSSKHA